MPSWFGARLEMLLFAIKQHAMVRRMLFYLFQNTLQMESFTFILGIKGPDLLFSFHP